MRGALYDASITTRSFVHAFTAGSTHAMLRATWFVNLNGGGKSKKWSPLVECLAQKIEDVYLAQTWHTLEDLSSPLATESFEGGPWTLILRSPTECYLAKTERTKTDALKGLFKRKTAQDLPPGALLLSRGFPTDGPLATEGGLDLELDDFASRTPVSHVLLAVHGVGQNLSLRRNQNRPSEIAESCDALRKQLFVTQRESSVPPTHSHTTRAPPPEGRKGRLEVLPVNWRGRVTMPVDTLTPLVSPTGNARVRNLLANTMMEVLAYTSRDVAQTMINALASELDQVFSAFQARNPNFRGRISIFAHSLGSVMTYDLLCNQRSTTVDTGLSHGHGHGHGHPATPVGVDASPFSSTPSTSRAPSSTDALAPPLRFPQLPFSVDHLVLVGSPLTALLALRGFDPLSDHGRRWGSSRGRAPHTAGGSMYETIPNDGIPSVRRLWNLFDPLDPIAYRIEPLLHPKFAHAAPIAVARSPTRRAGQGAVQRLQAGLTGLLLNGLNLGVGGAGRGEAAGAETEAEAEAEAAAAAEAEAEAEAAEVERRAHAASYGQGALPSPADLEECARAWTVLGGGSPNSASLRAKEGEVTSTTGRLDFSLHDTGAEGLIVSLRALAAHTGYWAHPDVALFLLETVLGEG